MRTWFGLALLLMSFQVSQANAAVLPEDAVRAVLTQQQDSWNRGDVREFMNGYEHSEKVTFIGTHIERGYEQVLNRYLKHYPNRDAMGTLTFSDMQVQLLSPDCASVLGRWHLDRKGTAGGATGGYFTLLLRRTKDGWKIFQDHTSVE